MATTYYAPDPIQSTQFIPGSATPANGGQLFFYLAGTSTKQTVYKDNAAATAWSNPIVLDSGGNLPLGGEVWFTQGISYKVIFAPANDADPPASPYWTKDNLTGINDVSSTTSEWISGPAPTFVNATSFTLTGDQTATFTVGRRVRTTNTGGTVYSTITNSVFGALTTVTVVNDSSTLDSGLSAVAYSILASNNISVPQSSFNVQPKISGRLTLTSGQPVSTTDTVSTMLYWTAYRGNTVDIYDGSANWRRYSFSEVSSVVPAATGVRDVFIYATSGILAITTVPWTNNTTRSSSLAYQNGVRVLTGQTSRLYLGSYWATSGSIPDTASTRVLSNYWNAIQRPLVANSSSGSWVTSGSLNWRPWNTELNAKAQVVCCEPDSVVDANVSLTGLAIQHQGASFAAGIGTNVTSAVSANEMLFSYVAIPNSTTPGVAIARYTAAPGAGLNDLNLLYTIVTTTNITLTGGVATTTGPGAVSANGLRGFIMG